MNLLFVALCSFSIITRIAAQNTDDLNIRLVDGGTETQGRLEVRIDGTWGTVCDDLFDTNEAVVVCRELGFTDLTQSNSHWNSHYGSGSLPFLLDDLKCLGTEDTILDCPHRGVGVHNCYPSERAGVSCAAAGKDGCLEEPDCMVPAAECPYGVIEYVAVPHRRCPICRCASCPAEPPCPTDCASGETEFFEDTYCQRCRCVPHDWPERIVEPNSISVGLLVAVLVVALGIPLAALAVVLIIKRNQDKELAKHRGRDRDANVAAPKQDNWFNGGKA